MRIAKFTIVENIFLSFKHGKEGYSARKASAFSCFMTAFYMVIRDKIPEANRIHAFYALCLTAVLCLGLVTIPQLIEMLTVYKNQKTNENNEPK